MKKEEYLTYSRESGFNIVKAIDEQDAEDFDTIVLDKTEEIDSIILERISFLIKVE